MRFAGDLVKQANPNDIISPRNVDEIYRFELDKRMSPVLPGFDPGTLAPALEITPRPGAEVLPQNPMNGPALDLQLDKYIKSDPRSGVAMLLNTGLL